MKKSPYETLEFRKLKEEWYDKLEKSGFKDIESDKSKTNWLNSWHDSRFKSVPIVQRIAAENYYRWAQGLLISFRFKNKTHRIIWEFHCEGKSKREIAVLIKDEKPTYKREQIGNIINSIKSTRRT